MFPTVTVTQPGRTNLYLSIVEKTVFGRECEGVLVADEKVSRRHLSVMPEGPNLRVADLGSTNGSFIDGLRIDGESILASGSTLSFGDTTIRIEAPPAPG